MAVYTLPLDPVVNIMVNLSARSAVRKQFNLALLMGDIGSVDFGDSRIRTYSNLQEMLSDGFTTEDRLYKAAALIFGQAKNLKNDRRNTAYRRAGENLTSVP